MRPELTARAPLFIDLDGVILDPSRRYFGLHCDILRELGMACPPLAEFWRQKRTRVPLETLLKADDGTVADPVSYRRRWHEGIEQPTYLRLDEVVAGARQRLVSWREQRPLCLVTLRRNRATLLEQLDRLELRELFDEVLAAGERPFEQPAELKAELIRASRNFLPSAAVIGDTEADIRAGKRLGLATIAIAGGLRDPGLLAAENPDSIVADLTEVAE